jgi:hypothetical protein
MTRETIINLATDAKRFEILTRHLKINGNQLNSLALQLENERQHDPLRQVLETRKGLST